jgi:hypothetical protein
MHKLCDYTSNVIFHAYVKVLILVSFISILFGLETSVSLTAVATIYNTALASINNHWRRHPTRPAAWASLPAKSSEEPLPYLADSVKLLLLMLFFSELVLPLEVDPSSISRSITGLFFSGL